MGGLAGVFYSIDPEVMYVGNALSYIKIHQIQYIDHPGTPTIIALAYLLWPWRIYAKLIAHTPFVLWSLRHYDLVFWYLRLWQGLILGGAVWFFLKAITLSTDSKLATLFAWLALLVFSPTLRLGSGITPETMSFLITSIWLLLLAKHLKRPAVNLIPVLGLVSGLAVANKFTNLFLMLAATGLPLTLWPLSWPQKLANSLIAFLMATIGFVVGTWAIRDKYQALIKWLIDLVTSTGIHAGGEKALFDISSHWRSIRAIYHQEVWIAVFSVLLITILLFQVRRRRKIFHQQALILAGVFGAGILIMAKYPLSYYQLTNYVVVVFLLSVLLGRLNRVWLVTLILILFTAVKPGIASYLSSVSAAVTRTMALETFIRNHPAEKAAVWEWGRAKAPAVLWTISSDWHGEIFAPEREGLKLPFYELSAVPSGKLFDLCWDQLFIQKASVAAFLGKYPEIKLATTSLIGSDDMYLVRSKHCGN